MSQRLLVSKIGALILLMALRLLAGLLPLKIFRKLNKWCRRGVVDVDVVGAGGGSTDAPTDRRRRIDLLLSVFLCFGAGLLISTTFVHMLPEVRESFDALHETGHWPVLETFPFAEGIVCLGFFAVYLLEELGETLVPSSGLETAAVAATSSSSSKAAAAAAAAAPPAEAASDSESASSSSSSSAHAGAVRVCHNGVKDVDHHGQGQGQGHGHGHGHSHGAVLGDLPTKSLAAAVRGFLVVAALSFHSVFEGMAIGLQTQVRDVWFLFGAVAVHELAIIFCLGLEMLASRIRIRIYVLYMVLLSLVTPLGVAVGVAITEYADADRSPAHALVVAVLRAVATGTLLYVTFMEVLERERKKEGHRLVKFVSVFCGFLLLSLLEVAGGHGDHVGHAEELRGGVATPHGHRHHIH